MTEIERDIIFADTETLGLHPDAPIWEYASIRISEVVEGVQNAEIVTEFQIQHDPGGWLETMPEEFRADYVARYDETAAFCERSAAGMIYTATKDAIIIGCNPGFDIERLAKLLQRNGIEPAWHYHPIDVPSVALGYLAHGGVRLPTSKWKSDHLSLAAFDVDSAKFDRHTAMGDVRWTLAQWESAMDGTSLA